MARSGSDNADSAANGWEEPQDGEPPAAPSSPDTDNNPVATGGQPVEIDDANFGNDTERVDDNVDWTEALIAESAPMIEALDAWVDAVAAHRVPTPTMDDEIDAFSDGIDPPGFSTDEVIGN